MAYYSTIKELIESVNTEEISYRNLHTDAYIRNKGEIIKIPYKSLIREYMPFFRSCVIEGKLNSDEMYKYKFKPKRLSYDLYGTTELWSALLELNNMISLLDFNTDTVKLFEPREFKRLLNEAMILEGLIK